MAFPQREDFTGIVYLHGSIKEPPEHLVVTDADFGAVYLDALWTAAQFLSRVFRSSTVLFVGYSHQDTLMKYLARALPSDTDRFAFCVDDPSEIDRWRSLGIEPVVCTGHEDLPKLIQKWDKRCRMGMLDHDRRVKSIVQDSPPLTLEDESYMQEIVGSAERQRLFTENARGIEWLKWVMQQPSFQRIFDSKAEWEESDHLARWFAEHCATSLDQRARDGALSALWKCGGRFSPNLWFELTVYVARDLKLGGGSAAGQSVEAEAGKEIELARRRDARRWVPLLIQRRPAGGKNHLWRLLDSCAPSANCHEVLLLLNCLLEPEAIQTDAYTHFATRRPVLEAGLGGADCDVGLLEHTVRSYWDERLQLACAADVELAVAIADIACRHLIGAQRVVAAGGRENGLKMLSLRRSAIERHEQDIDLDEGIGLLIDMARDSLDVLLEHHPAQTQHFLALLAESSAPLLRRLAIHGWSERADVTSDEKIDWLMETGWMLDVEVRHESLRLLANTVSGASPETVGALIEQVEAGVPEPQEPVEDDLAIREAIAQGVIYEFLEWIARHAPESEIAEQAYSQSQANHPERRPSRHPDFPIWAGKGERIPPPEANPDALYQELKSDPLGTIAELVSWYQPATDGSGQPDDGSPATLSDRLFPDWRSTASSRGVPGWDNAQQQLLAVIEDHPDAGIGVLDVLTGPDAPNDRAAAQILAQTVLMAWTSAEIDGGLCNDITGRLSGIWETGAAEWGMGSGISGSGVSWLDHAFNHWADQIAQIVLRLVDVECRRDGWAGLSGPLRDVAETMLAGSDYPSKLAEVVLVAKVRFFFAVDEQWCSDKVLPLLNPSADEDRAVRCWDSYLFAGGGGIAKMLEAGLLDLYMGMVPHFNQHLSDRNSWWFYKHLASIALFSGLDPMAHSWLSRFTADSDIEGRVRWIQMVTEFLSELPCEAVDAQWDAWMREYWERRLESTPRAMTNREAACLSGWSVYLQDRFPEAVDLACQHEAPLDCLPDPPRPIMQLSRGSENIRDGDGERADQLEAHPEQAAKLITHMLAGTEALVSLGALQRFELDTLIPKLVTRLDSKQAVSLREQAMRLGIRTSGP